MTIRGFLIRIDSWCIVGDTHFENYFSYIVVVSFIDGATYSNLHYLLLLACTTSVG
jgi:hypothetical protein